jgi:hypothetical protein
MFGFPRKRLPIPEVGREYVLILYPTLTPRMQHVKVTEVRTIPRGTFIETQDSDGSYYKRVYSLCEFWETVGVSESESESGS